MKVSFICILLVWSAQLWAQVTTTEGKEFWFGFMENHETSLIELEVYISARDSTSGTISVPGIGWEENFETGQDTTVLIVVPLWAMAEGSEKVQNKGIHVSSDQNISIYAHNKRDRSSDVTVILPVEALGKNYIVTTYDGAPPSRFSEFLIVAIEDDTEMEIIPSAATVGGVSAGDTLLLELDEGESYQIQSSGDLTGTHINSLSGNNSDCKNFAVFSGNEWTNVGECGPAQDHLFEQMFPVNTWGKEYIVIPFKERNGDLIRILASEDSTLITIDNTFSLYLDKGEFYSRTEFEPSLISSNKPISVAQFSRSQSCDNLPGDPFMIMLSPTEQLLTKVTYNALEVHVIDNYYMNVITNSNSIDQLLFDGMDIIDDFETFPIDDKYSFVRLEIEEGNHTIESDSGFIAYVYGFGPIESFGYSAGITLDNLLLEIEYFDPATEIPIRSDTVCIGEEITFSVNSDDKFKFFDWDFQDGNIASGKTVQHRYEIPGEYFIQMEANTASGDCAFNQEARSRIVVLAPVAPILGPPSVCPFTPDVIYRVDDDPLNIYQWFIKGGEIDQVYDNDSISINWDDTNDDAFIKLLTTDKYGCTGDTTKLPVKINIQLDPIAPLGVDSLCQSVEFNDYFVYENKSSMYNWTVSGGEIIKGHGSHKITVNWNGYGEKRLFYSEQSNLLDVCDGKSDTLTVFIEREPLEDLNIHSNSKILLGDSVFLSFEYDSAFQFMSWNFDNGVTRDSIPISFPQTYRYECPGVYVIEATTYTSTLCENIGSGTFTVEVVPPELELITVSNSLTESALELKWDLSGSNNYDKAIYLLNKKSEGSTWENSFVFDTNTSSFTDRGVEVGKQIYDYQLMTNINCVDTLFSEIHRNIVLRKEVAARDSVLIWNDYRNWRMGVENYEVWSELDSSGYINSGSGDLRYVVDYDNNGFSWCFRVKALESGGNEAIAWSNEQCFEFIPEIKVYNVLTPGNDTLNEVFYIENIQQYPLSELTILNRHGSEVYKTIHYQNDWTAENVNNGVYYYYLELREPRNPVKLLKGSLMVIK